MDNKKILLEHGSGGILSSILIEEFILPRLKNEILERLEDSAVFYMNGQKIAFTTDSYVVSPIFFPGGDIGKLAINGTINDLSMAGAIPIYLSLGLIIEEGFSLENLQKIILSIEEASLKANIKVVTGDTKVVPKGACDGIFINTSGIGIVPNEYISLKNIRENDAVIVSGGIGEHGTTIMALRAGYDRDNIPIKSDTMSLNGLIKKLLENFKEKIHYMKDPTRGGLSTILWEISHKTNKKIEIFEENIPIKREVNMICEILGLDPLYLANEGKCVMLVEEKFAAEILNFMRKFSEAVDASIIGKVMGCGKGVNLNTIFGGTRIIQPLSGEPLPRIC